MRVSVFLLLFNLLIIGSAFFSRHPGQSLWFVCDMFMLSFWFLLFDFEKSDANRYLRLLAYVISLSSLARIGFFVLQAGPGSLAAVFEIPILQGMAAALAVLYFLHALLQKVTYADTALLIVNAGAMVVSAFPAAFLALALFAAAMIFYGRRKWLFYLLAVLILLLVIPNPLQRALGHTFKKDPYADKRLDIWNLSARMFRACPWTGVGPDLFSAAARRFNFPRENARARYLKPPASPYSDYWKIICENGLAGLIFVLLFLFFTIRRMLAPPWSDLPKVLLAFLLLQMLFFNFIFNFFFLLVFLFLLYSFFWRRLLFFSLDRSFRIFLSGLLLVVFIIFYLFPFFADRLLQTAAAEKNIVRRFALLNRAALFCPLDDRVPMVRAKILRGFFKATANLDAWQTAWEDSRLSQKLNSNSSEACILEAGLFADVFDKKIIYPALAEEILSPLQRAEKLEPFNPFLKLQQALVLADFGRSQEARRLALAALDLEPDYVAALFFMRQLAGSSAEAAVWQKRIAQIQDKAKSLKAKPGSYLYDLYRLPEKKGAGQ